MARAQLTGGAFGLGADDGAQKTQDEDKLLRSRSRSIIKDDDPGGAPLSWPEL